ncbi:MAG: M28 family peptidase, partial [Chloroflexota bacterium]
MDIEELIRDTITICAVASPTGHEEERATEMLERLSAVPGLTVGLDRHGNVVARVPGSAPAGPPVVVAAHLDTVFGHEIKLRPGRAGERLLGPGIGDNSLALAVL